MLPLSKLAPWFIRGIFNKQGDVEFTIYLFELGIRIIGAHWEVEIIPSDDDVAAVEAELAGKLIPIPVNPQQQRAIEGACPLIVNTVTAAGPSPSLVKEGVGP